MLNPYYESCQNKTELEHYGVLGMKWGIRRYQNADGTLTAAGKKRYAGATQEQIETSERRKAKVVKAAKVAATTAAKTAAIAFASGIGGYVGSTLAAQSVKVAVSAGTKAIESISKSDGNNIMETAVETALDTDNPFNVTKSDVKQMIENFGEDKAVEAVISGYIPDRLCMETLWETSDLPRNTYAEPGMPDSIAKQIFFEEFQAAIDTERKYRGVSMTDQW